MMEKEDTHLCFNLNIYLITSFFIFSCPFSFSVSFLCLFIKLILYFLPPYLYTGFISALCVCTFKFYASGCVGGGVEGGGEKVCKLWAIPLITAGEHSGEVISRQANRCFTNPSHHEK